MIHGELSAIDDQLCARRPFRFTARAVEGHDNPQAVRRTVATSGWTPIDARIHITDVLGVVRKFGGVGLYGPNGAVSVRELIMNAVDAIRARRKIEGRPEDWGEIVVRHRRSESEYWIEVEDNGIGISPALMAGPLLDFGTSYWTTSTQDFTPQVLSLRDDMASVFFRFHVGRPRASNFAACGSPEPSD